MLETMSAVAEGLKSGSSILSSLGIGSGGGLSTRKAAALSHDYWQRSVREELPLRVEGAKAAGLHPLAALGASPAGGYSPSIPVGQDTGRVDFESLGQNIGRAQAAYLTRAERVKQDAMDSLKLENAKLQNEILRGQATAINKANLTPPFPSGSLTGDIQFNPDEVTRSLPGASSFTAGSNVAKPAVTTIRNRDGSITTVPSPDAKQAIEDNLIYELDHFIRNRVNPALMDTWESIKSGARRSWWNPYR